MVQGRTVQEHPTGQSEEWGRVERGEIYKDLNSALFSSMKPVCCADSYVTSQQKLFLSGRESCPSQLEGLKYPQVPSRQGSRAQRGQMAHGHTDIRGHRPQDGFLEPGKQGHGGLGVGG